jgi:hypothetical protein
MLTDARTMSIDELKAFRHLQRCVDVQRKLARRNLRLDPAHAVFLRVPLTLTIRERTYQILHAEDDRHVCCTIDTAH